MKFSKLIAASLVALLALSGCSGSAPIEDAPAASTAPATDKPQTDSTDSTDSKDASKDKASEATSASESTKSEADDTAKSETTSRLPDSEYYPVTISNYDNEAKPIDITFTKAPTKVVSIFQSPTETLLALGLGDRIISASGFDTEVRPDLQAEFKKIKHVQENEPDKETVMNLEPDFITGWYGVFLDDGLGNVPAWIERGTNTYMQQNSGPIYLIGKEGGKVKNPLYYELDDIKTMGKIFNREAEANKIVEDMETSIAEVAKAVADKPKVKALIVETSGDGKFRLYGSDSIGGDIVKQVGGDLVGGKNATLGKEDLVKLDPDVIFSVYYGDAIGKEDAVKHIMDDQALANLAAVKNKRVLPIVLSEVYSTGVRTIDGIHTIVKGLYPDYKAN